MKKLLATLLALALVITCFTACGEEEEPVITIAPTATPAPEATPLPDIEIEYDHTKFVIDGVVLKAYIGNEKDVEIPEQVVVIDDNAFKNCSTVESIKFVDTITDIGDYAFFGCSALKEINCPKLVRNIGEYAFASCASLEKFTTKTNATNIGKGALSGNTNLKTVTLSTSLLTVPERLFFNCTSLETVKLSSATSIGDYAFLGCESLKSIEATAVKIVGNQAFMGCTAFENAAFSTSITEVGSNAFADTKWLTDSIAKADAATKIKEAFVTVGKGVLIHYSPVFANNSTEIDSKVLQFDTTVKSIADGAYDEVKDVVETIEFPTTVIRIEPYAFANFSKVKSVTFPNSITELNNGIFAGCSALEEIKILGKVTKIGANAFSNCIALKSITLKKDATEAATVPTLTLPASVETIGDYAFDGCVEFEAIELGTSLTKIGACAFKDCSKVSSVTIGEKVATIGTKAFAGTAWFDNWKGDEQTKFLIVGNGVLIKAIDSDYTSFDKTINSISVSLDGVSEVKEKHFYDNKNVYSIVIPEGVTAIGDYAFYYCENLAEITLPSTLKTIGKSAFYGCKNLTYVAFPASITSIGDSAFFGCTGLSFVSLPIAVETIGKFAFYDCLNIESFMIPNTLKTVGEYAFGNTSWYNKITEKFNVIGDGVLVKYYAFEAVTTVTANDKIKTISGGAFDGTYRLEEITLPDNITEISAFAFSGSTTLKKITAKGVTTVGERAFNQCKSLETVDLANATANQAAMDSRALSN